MSTEEDGLIAEFPKAVRGYSPAAVDAYVRQLGVRLTSLQTKLDEQKKRADSVASELEKVKSDLTGYSDKQAAIASAMVAMEQRRMNTEQELEKLQAKAAEEADRILADARVAAHKILDDSQAENESLMKEAREKVEESTLKLMAQNDGEVKRLKTLRGEYANLLTKIKNELEEFVAKLPQADISEDDDKNPNGSTGVHTDPELTAVEMAEKLDSALAQSTD